MAAEHSVHLPEETAAAPERGRLGLLPRLRRLAPPPNVSEALWLFLTLRVGFSAFAWLMSYMTWTAPPCYNHAVETEWITKPEFYDTGVGYRLLGLWQQWDGCWYLKIATFGYEPGLTGTAFFPLYPSLISLLGPVFGGNLTLAALFISAVAYIAAIAGLYGLVARDFGRERAQRTVLYISIFPSAFFFFAPFTEALFLAAAVWAIYAARTDRWVLAGVTAVAAALTRQQGVLLVLPLGWEAWRAWRAYGTLPDAEKWRLWARRGGLLLVLGLPVVAMLVYAQTAKNIAGISPFEAQDWWGSTYMAPWNVARAAWDWTFERNDAIEGLNLGVLVLFFVLLIAGLRLLPLTYSLYAVPQLLLVSARLNPTPLTSTTRYMLVLFPAFVVLAILGGSRRFNGTWVIFSTMLLSLLLYIFLISIFVA